MTISPELIALICNLIVIVGVFTKLERRLTKLETVQELILNNMVSVGIVERRHEKTPR